MTRAGFAVALIVMGVIVPVTLQKGIKEGRAQAQTASPESTIWNHNGSVMHLVANGSSREFYYQKPRSGMLDAGARPGSLLFRGHLEGRQYSGTAYFFNPHCGPIPFEVKGATLEDEERIVLTGQAPRVGRNCRTYGSYTTNLEFRRLKSDEANQPEEAKTATPAPALVESKPGLKPEMSSPSGGEVASAPREQRSPRNEAPPKDSSASLVDTKALNTSIAQTTVPDETQGAKGPDNYLWGVAFIVMSMWLLIKLFGKNLIGMK